MLRVLLGSLFLLATACGGSTYYLVTDSSGGSAVALGNDYYSRGVNPYGDENTASMLRDLDTFWYLTSHGKEIVATNDGLVACKSLEGRRYDSLDRTDLELQIKGRLTVEGCHNVVKARSYRVKTTEKDEAGRHATSRHGEGTRSESHAVMHGFLSRLVSAPFDGRDYVCVAANSPQIERCLVTVE